MRKPSIVKLIQWVIKITVKSQIAPLPRIAAADYSRLDADSARIMTRYGIRSPSGLRSAMKRHECSTVDELERKLEHHRAKRKIQSRLSLGIRRLSGAGATRQNPHMKEIRASVGKTETERLMRERIKRLKA